ncbi:phage terminase large subunit [Hydrocarboniphaga effusa]|uniref:phage terminase large subunit n=1 Tax=Hydrocarboniphaga effusa TaxID=243629 RepID=UPI003BA9F71D
MAKSIEFRKLTRKRFLEELRSFGVEQRTMIEASVGGFAVDAKASEQRVARVNAPGGFRFFCETYFPHLIDPTQEPSAFQIEAYKIPEELQRVRGSRAAIAAPRGEGKSTILIQLQALWRIVRKLSHYMPLIMDAREQAELMADTIKAELEVNPRLRMDFPDVCGKGRVWNARKFQTPDGQLMMECFGAQKRIRGRRFGAWRPDFIFLDDFENDDNVTNPKWRQKRVDWLLKVVSNLGPPNGSMRQMYVGTILHIDSVLVRTMKNPRWKSRARQYPSIYRWPDRMDLWDQWEERFVNDSEEEAEAFYVEHKADMDAGAVVSWPGVRPLIELMKLRAEDHKAFETEHQHNPVDPEGHPFVGSIYYWTHIKREWAHFGAHDPSMGKHARRGDPAATVVGALDRESGKLHVVEALIARRKPEKQLADIIRLQAEFKCLLWGIESVQFQEFFRQVLVAESAKMKIPVPARGIDNLTDKDLRIESLQPHCANKLILFGRNQKTLVDMFEQWPDADHDDGPDAVEMLWQIALRGMVSVAGGLKPGRKSQSSKMMQGYG